MPDDLLTKLPPDYEVRAVAEVRAADPDDPPGTFAGYASVFWQVDDWLTAFAPKAFKRSIAHKEGRIPMLWFHDPAALIGPVVESKEDARGLFFKARAGETGHGAMLRDQMALGFSHLGLSHGFRRIKDRTAEEDDPLDFSGLPTEMKGAKRDDVRVITEASVMELSALPWAFASNAATSIDSARKRREAAEVGVLSSLLDAIKAGDLDEERAALVEQIVLASQPPGPPADEQAPTADEARREPDFALLAAAASTRARLVLAGVNP